MTEVPVFTQIENTRLYVLSGIQTSGLAPYWAGYFAPATNTLGVSASTQAVWQDTGGFYLFMDNRPANWMDFTNELAALCPQTAKDRKIRSVWIANAGLASSFWKISYCYADATGTGATVSWKLARSFAFPIGEYLFYLSGNSSLSYIEDALGGGIKFTGGGNFQGPAGGYSFAEAKILFSGPAQGVFSALLDIPAPVDISQPDLWQSLHIGLQYAAVPQTDPADFAFTGATRILFMPVFERQTTALTMGIQFDPILSSRIVLNLCTPGVTTPVLKSYLRTTRGYSTKLQPLPAQGKIPDAGFVLGQCPVHGDNVTAGSTYHFSPQGLFQLSVIPPPNPGTDQTRYLLLGISALEYVKVAQEGYFVLFQGGQPAFVPRAEADQPVTLLYTATTSHLTVMAANGDAPKPVYYAQPRVAPLYSGINQATTILNFNPMPAFSLPFKNNPPPVVFPVGIYAGLPAKLANLARELEQSSLAPFRHALIGATYGTDSRPVDHTPPTRRLRKPGDKYAVTPQGLIAELKPDYDDFDGLLLGNMPGSQYPSVDLTVVRGKLKESLQSNQLFFVASNADEFMNATSVRYQLNENQRQDLEALNVPKNIVDAVYVKIHAAVQPFDTETLFLACIMPEAQPFKAEFLKVAGILKVEIDDWTFQLSPRSWRSVPENPTMMIAKFCNRSLADLAGDTGSWSWQKVAKHGTSLTQTQAALQRMIDEAAAADTNTPLGLFFRNTVNDPLWNGFLFLNVPVDITSLPANLSFLTAGIEPGAFFAHHIGFSQTPFNITNGQPVPSQTAAFGLINYHDPLDLYREESIPVAFKVTRLLVRFANAAIAEFSVEAELMLNRLFGAPLIKLGSQRGNNLIISGSCQRSGGVPNYIFTLTGQNVFNASGSALAQVEILSIQMVNGAGSDASELLTTFILNGNLRFLLIPEFDLFSYGADLENVDGFLRFNGLPVDMRFHPQKPADQTFLLRENSTVFDPISSVTRRSSLVGNFPLAISGIIAGTESSGQSPEDLGFTSITVPLDQSTMQPPWYGLVFNLDLGTFGALTGSESFKISILAGWMKGASADDAPVYVGIKLPGIQARGGSFPLQGILKIGFHSFSFKRYVDEGKTGYLLRMSRFALSVLGWSFPPGKADFVLFGQPDNPKGSLGWYAAYVGDEEDEKIVTPAQRRLQSGRRLPIIP